MVSKIENYLFDALVRLLHKRRRCVHFNIALIECRFFGHAALEPEVVAIMAHQTKASYNPREIFLLSLPLRTPRNARKLVALRKRHFYWVPTFIVTRIANSQIRQGLNPVVIKSFGYHELNCLTAVPSSLPSSKPILSRFEKGMHPINQNRNSLVTLSLREPIIHQLKDPFRDRKLDDFVDSVTQLTDLGLSVVRMGRDGSESSRVLDKQVKYHDYASGGIHRLSLELEYARKSLFCLSSITGFDALCLALRRPVFYPDSARIWYLFLGTELTFFSLPTFLDMSTRAPLCLTDLLDRGWARFKNPEDFSDASIDVQFTEPIEVADYVVSMAKEMLGLITRTDSHNAMQERFYELLMSNEPKVVLDRHGIPKANLNIAYLEKMGSSFVN